MSVHSSNRSETDAFFFGICYEKFRNAFEDRFPNGVDTSTSDYRKYVETEKNLAQEDDETIRKIRVYEISQERFLNILNESIRDGISTYSKTHAMVRESVAKKSDIENFLEPYVPEPDENQEDYDERVDIKNSYKMLFNMNNDISLLENEQERLNSIKASIAKNISELAILGIEACEHRNGDFSYFVDQNWNLFFVHGKDGLEKTLSATGIKSLDKHRIPYHQ